MASPKPIIAIIGGGLGGLTLARVLRRHAVPFTLYEAESSFSSRYQGGSLDMHEPTGQRAITLAGLYDGFKKLARPEDDTWRMTDQHNNEIFSFGAGGKKPEIDRGQLRQLLLDGIDRSDNFKWSHKVVGIAPTSDDRHTLSFADGASTTVDLVVGADGAWSKVRSLVSSTQPDYTSVSFIETSITNADARFPSLAKIAGRGSFAATEKDKMMMSQRTSAEDLRLYLAVRKPLGIADELVGKAYPGLPRAGTSPEMDAARDTAKARFVQEFPDWSPDLLEFIAAADGPIIPRPLFAMPIGFTWPHQKGVTLLGDAAHLLSPYGGEGANLAMIDGAELGVAIAEANPGQWDAAVAAYETVMQQRAAKASQESTDGMEAAMGGNAAEAAKGWVEEA
jgi:2-polyprenyl-6-methoxyphenol hydroxylase-like FAD-dependent oxidoreductase